MTIRRIDSAERRARLAWRHRLLPALRTDDVAEIADALVALHSSDPVTVFLSAMVRMRSPSVAAVEKALYQERTVVRHHAMRRTLWVATPHTVKVMHSAATRQLAAREHRRTAQLLAASGVQHPDEWLAEARTRVVAALHEHGPMTARKLGVTVPELAHKLVLSPGKSYSATVAAHTRVLLMLGFEGAVVRTRPTGSWVNGAYAYAAADRWLDGGLGDIPHRDACRELAAAYLRAFGPVSTADLQWWAGWTAATTRRALADCAAEPVELDTGPGWVAEGDLGTPDAEPWVALLPGLDPTTMGWKGRSFYLPDEAAAAFDSYGNAGPTVWVEGEVVGAWVQHKDGAVRTCLFRDLPARRRRQVDERAQEVAELIGDVRFTVRFPPRVYTSRLK